MDNPRGGTEITLVPMEKYFEKHPCERERNNIERL
jgi:hypothetical protein